MPSQKQLKWSQLKVGSLVVVSTATLATLIVLMGGNSMFTHKITIKTYFPDASGLTEGAPVRLSGVDIGNVKSIKVVQSHPPERPVETVMRVNTKYGFFLRKDSKTMLTTAGVLGQTYINIDSSSANKPQAEDGDVLESKDVPGYDDVVRSANSSLQNLDILVKRLDRILTFVESGQGSIGKLIYDPGLYNQAKATITQVQTMMNDITQGNGSLGKLIEDDDLYNRANSTLDKINKMVDDVNAGNGTVGKLLKDSSLYDNANKSVANVRQLTDDINAGKGALGKLARDQEFANKLQNTMNRVSEMVDKLNSGQGAAGKFLNDPSLYDNTNKLLTDTQELIKAVRQNPKKYLTIHLKLF